MGKKILCLGVAMGTFLMLMLLGHFFLKPHNYDSVVVLDEGWRVYYNDTVYENVALSDLRKIIGDGSHKGDVIHMVHPSVEANDFETPTIMFESRFSAWILYTNTIEIDRGFMDSYKAGKFIGCENNFVNLPAQIGRWIFPFHCWLLRMEPTTILKLRLWQATIHCFYIVFIIIYLYLYRRPFLLYLD